MEQKRGPANLLRGKESVGGKLILEGRRLRFEPHRANVQRDPEIIHVSDIIAVQRRWTRFLGLIPLAPNAIDVVMLNRERFRFTVAGRKAWIAELEAARAETPRG